MILMHDAALCLLQDALTANIGRVGVKKMLLHRKQVYTTHDFFTEGRGRPTAWPAPKFSGYKASGRDMRASNGDEAWMPSDLS